MTRYRTQVVYKMKFSGNGVAHVQRTGVQKISHDKNDEIFKFVVVNWKEATAGFSIPFQIIKNSDYIYNCACSHNKYFQLLVKFVWSRWQNIGQILSVFRVFTEPRAVQVLVVSKGG